MHEYVLHKMHQIRTYPSNYKIYNKKTLLLDPEIESPLYLSNKEVYCAKKWIDGRFRFQRRIKVDLLSPIKTNVTGSQ